MRRDQWTDECLDLLRKMWTAGATVQAIADRLGGVSRSAVSGKIRRLRLGAAVAVPTPAPDARRAKKWEALSPSLPPLPRGKRLIELTNDTCRWPQGRPGTANFFFCGEPGADLACGMPYCALHARRAYLVRVRVAKKTKPAVASADAMRPIASPSLAPARTYVWRRSVRHPAPRWK